MAFVVRLDGGNRTVYSVGMRCLAELDARRIRGLLFDLDDTFLDAGRLQPEALRSLYALRESGLRLIAVTGRPAGYGQVLIDQWPVDAIIVENGATYFLPGRGTSRCVDLVTSTERALRRQHLQSVSRDLMDRFSFLRPTGDCSLRRSDFTFDVAEADSLTPTQVADVRAEAEALGVRVTVSSIHLHLSFDTADKASTSVRVLVEHFGEDATACRYQYVYVGDSANDGPCFAAFHHSVGVANLSGRPSLLPRFRTSGESSRGFCELAEQLLTARPDAS